jgi:probable F420-dependent oxidoreductase
MMNLVFRMPGGTVPARVDLLSASSIGRVARTAEDAGWAGVCFDEHPIPPAYWRNGGDGHDAVDPFVALAAAAAVTQRIRLVVYASIVSIRNPFLLAKTVATLDVISEGRVDLGMVAGYLPEEFAALGVPFERRNEYFEECVDAMKAAWTGEPVTLRTERFDAVDVCAQPRPVQRPHPPLWVGGNSRSAMSRVVKYGAGWMALVNPRGRGVSRRSPALETVDDFKRLLALLHAEAEAAGRADRIPVMVSANFNPDDPVHMLKRTVEQFGDAGAGWITVNVPSNSVDEACRSLELLADELGACVVSS